jgi:hypothetical protein
MLSISVGEGSIAELGEESPLFVTWQTEPGD